MKSKLIILWVGLLLLSACGKEVAPATPPPAEEEKTPIVTAAITGSDDALCSFEMGFLEEGEYIGYANVFLPNNFFATNAAYMAEGAAPDTPNRDIPIPGEIPVETWITHTYVNEGYLVNSFMMTKIHSQFNEILEYSLQRLDVTQEKETWLSEEEALLIEKGYVVEKGEFTIEEKSAVFISGLHPEDGMGQIYGLYSVSESTAVLCRVQLSGLEGKSIDAQGIIQTFLRRVLPA